MVEHRIELAGGVTLHVEEDGHGPALLLLHAGVADRHMWDAQWAWLSQSFRVVRWDWRGFGETPHVPGPFSYTDDVVRVMDALNIAQAMLMKILPRSNASSLRRRQRNSVATGGL